MPEFQVTQLILIAALFLSTVIVACRKHLSKAWLPALALPAIGAVLFVAGCGSSSSSDDSSGDATIKAVATTTQVGDLVREVGGDQADVTQILQSNTDPHDYEPRPSDIEAFTDADIVFKSGGHLDEWVEGVLADSGSDPEVVDLSANLPVELHGDEHEHEEEHANDEHAEEGEDEGEEIDPHWWHDPTNAEAAVNTVAKSLSKFNSGQSETFTTNAKQLNLKIAGVDAAFKSCLAAVAPENRKMVTDHDAFGYLANHFEIEVVGTVIPALTTQAQPSAGDLADLEDTIKKEKVKAVFPESSVSPKLSEAVASDTGASTDYVLYGDTLGPEGSEAATYVKMMESNADQIVRGLTGGKKGCKIS